MKKVFILLVTLLSYEMLFASPKVFPGNTSSAPTGTSTEGPAGRPNIELAPSTSGTINSLSSSVASSDRTSFRRYPQRSMNSDINYNMNFNGTVLPPNTSSPIPKNTN